MNIRTLPLKTSLKVWLAAIALLLSGVGLRLYDLTDQPIDFHPTRQLRNAIVARGLYFQLLPGSDPALTEDMITFGNATGQYEPPILESLVARSYLLAGGEFLWISRLWTTFFWLVGGVALFLLARRMLRKSYGVASAGGALLALGYYLFLPFAVQASRSFQPDPGMVMWILLCAYALYRWGEQPVWKWAIAAGLLGGMAVLTKVVAGYIVAGAAVAVVLSTLGLRRLWRNPQVYTMAALMLLPSLLYYSNRGGRASEFFTSWTLSLSHLLLQPATYVRWFSTVQDLMGLTALLLGLIGVLIATPRSRAFLLGLWGGYAIYGLFLPYQMYTHSYYHLQLVPIVALSVVWIGQLVVEKLLQQERTWQILGVLVLLTGLLYVSWISITEQALEDHRNEPPYWQEIASYLPTDGKIIALTQDYGYRLMYYGMRKVTLWPNRGERSLASLRGSSKDFEEYFTKRTEGKGYFLITAFNQFNDQPDLKAYLNDHFPVLAQNSGYIIYDLVHPLP